jgi:hypothetical protein
MVFPVPKSIIKDHKTRSPFTQITISAPLILVKPILEAVSIFISVINKVSPSVSSARGFPPARALPLVLGSLSSSGEEEPCPLTSGWPPKQID